MKWQKGEGRGHSWYKNLADYSSLFFSTWNCLPTPPHPTPPSPPPSPHADRVIDLIRHWVRWHYAVLTDKRIAKQLFSFPLSLPRGCVSKRRTGLHGQISLFILIWGLQYWLHFTGSRNFTPTVSTETVARSSFLRDTIRNITWNPVTQEEKFAQKFEASKSCFVRCWMLSCFLKFHL